MGIKRVKLNYKPIIKRRSNEVAYVVKSTNKVLTKTYISKNT